MILNKHGGGSFLASFDPKNECGINFKTKEQNFTVAPAIGGSVVDFHLLIVSGGGCQMPGMKKYCS